MTGFKAPLYLLQHASSQGFHTLLDAAALAPTTRISLSGPELNNSVDALTISMYKIIGYPTGLGALVIKKSFLNQLKKPWFAGGTVDIAQVPGVAYTLLDGPERFEVCGSCTIHIEIHSPNPRCVGWHYKFSINAYDPSRSYHVIHLDARTLAAFVQPHTLDSLLAF